MKLPSFMRRREVERPPEPVLRVGDEPLGDFIKRVWAAPALFNRAARRQARLWGRIWRWDRELLGIPANLPPRYARRHFNSETFLRPKTRRQRRHRARILRAMQRGAKA